MTAKTCGGKLANRPKFDIGRIAAGSIEKLSKNLFISVDSVQKWARLGQTQ
jgi:hypothetical protein